jgi:hypothetical protein
MRTSRDVLQRFPTRRNKPTEIITRMFETNHGTSPSVWTTIRFYYIEISSVIKKDLCSRDTDHETPSNFNFMALMYNKTRNVRIT